MLIQIYTSTDFLMPVNNSLSLLLSGGTARFLSTLFNGARGTVSVQGATSVHLGAAITNWGAFLAAGSPGTNFTLDSLATVDNFGTMQLNASIGTIAFPGRVSWIAT